MTRFWIGLFVCLSVRGGCAVWTPPPAGSACQLDNPGLYWLMKYPSSVPVPGLNVELDPLLSDPAFRTGIDTNGVQRFFFAVGGEHILELFAYFAPSDKYSWVLEIGERSTDSRWVAQPVRAGTTSAPRVIPLIGVAQPGDDVTLRSNSPAYVLAGARWTPRAEFEMLRVPQILGRLRRLQADPFFEERRETRAARMAELAELAMLSRNRAAADEALLQLTRATFWAAARERQPRDFARLGELFEMAAARIGAHPAVREMISAACEPESPLLPGFAHGKWCDGVQAVGWASDSGVALEGAPGWAASQWRLRARLEAIAAWWVQRRQRANGELGGGAAGDAEMARNWAPLASGFGSEVAAEGIRRLGRGPDLPVGPGQAQGTPEAILAGMQAEAERMEARLGVNFELLTSEALFTDVVEYRPSAGYQARLLGSGGPKVAVTWPASKTRFARAVLVSSSRAVTIRLYSFEEAASSAPVRLSGLDAGSYQWECGGQKGVVEVKDAAVAVEIPLSPRSESEFRVSPRS